MKDRAWFGVNHPFASLSALESQLAYKFPIVGGLYYTFDSNWSRHVSDLLPAAGRELMVAWMPQLPGSTLDLSDIPEGKFDEHIDQMLIGLRSFAGPVVCRWGHEPNGNWYSWAAAAGLGATPAQYIAAWRYIVARERGMAGTSNVRWFWCPNATDVPSATGAVHTIEDYFPGEAWVDLVGCDGFNEPTEWQTFDQVFAAPYARITKLSGKPFWVGETGCHEPLPHQHGVTKGDWINDMVNSDQFPNMRAVCYFDYDATTAGRADWSFNSSPVTLRSVVDTFTAMPVHVS